MTVFKKFRKWASKPLIKIEVSTKPEPVPTPKDAANPFVKEKHVVGYKAFGKNWTNRDYTYSPTEVNTYDGEVKICESGFHFCKHIGDVFDYISYENIGHLAKVEAWGDIQQTGNFEKAVARNLKVVKELPLDSDTIVDILLNRKSDGILKMNLLKVSDKKKKELSDLNYCVGDVENFTAKEVRGVLNTYLEEKLHKFRKSAEFFGMLSQLKQAAASGRSCCYFTINDEYPTPHDLDSIFVNELGYETDCNIVSETSLGGSRFRSVRYTVSF